MGHIIPLQQSGAAEARLGTPGRIVRAKPKIARTAMSLRAMADYASAFGEADAIRCARGWWCLSASTGEIGNRENRHTFVDPISWHNGLQWLPANIYPHRHGSPTIYTY